MTTPTVPRLDLHDLRPGDVRTYQADARTLPLADASVDLVVTSPPYWRKRDYGFPEQIGQEPTPEIYVASMSDALAEWWRVLRPSGSVFLNVGDTYAGRSLAGVPAMLETAALRAGWLVRNRIIWTKGGGMPSPARNRLTNRHEYILYLAKGDDYYYDLQGYVEYSGQDANPGDVWHVPLRRHMGDHLATFPPALVERAVVLACPTEVCTSCGEPRRRIERRTRELDPARPQARRAMELAAAAGLTDDHIAAVQATGISDAGKALRVQNGTGRNSARVQQLAAEAKKVLGGYFREFTFAKRETMGWTACACGAPFQAGVVLDPFAGTGTSLRAATGLGRAAVGIDFEPIALPAPGDQAPLLAGDGAAPLAIAPRQNGSRRNGHGTNGNSAHSNDANGNGANGHRQNGRGGRNGDGRGADGTHGVAPDLAPLTPPRMRAGLRNPPPGAW